MTALLVVHVFFPVRVVCLRDFFCPVPDIVPAPVGMICMILDIL